MDPLTLQALGLAAASAVAAVLVAVESRRCRAVWSPPPLRAENAGAYRALPSDAVSHAGGVPFAVRAAAWLLAVVVLTGVGTWLGVLAVAARAAQTLVAAGRPALATGVALLALAASGHGLARARWRARTVRGLLRGGDRDEREAVYELGEYSAIANLIALGAFAAAAWVLDWAHLAPLAATAARLAARQAGAASLSSFAATTARARYRGRWPDSTRLG